MSEVPIHEIVKELIDNLGTGKVYYLAGVKSRQMPKRWASPPGDPLHAVPRFEPARRLRLAHQAFTIVAEKEGSKDIAGRWMRGMNPLLSHRAPLEVIREFDADAPRVIRAAHQFGQ